MHRPLAFALVVVIGSVAGCSDEVSPQALGPPFARASFETSDGAVRTGSLGVADSPEERAQGLMGRRRLGPDAGMVFLYEAPTTGGFTMKDTLLPLSIAFWDGSGRVTDMLDMEPCADDPCPSYEPNGPYTRALEMHQGWFADHGVEVGDRVDLTVASE